LSIVRIENVWGKLKQRIKFTVAKRCPVNNKLERGEVVIEYVPRTYIIEHDSFATVLEKRYSNLKIYHEAFVDDVLNLVWDSVHPKSVTVTATFLPHKWMEVSCSKTKRRRWF